jgi:hypothetical protein
MISRTTIDLVRKVYINEFRRVFFEMGDVHLEPALRTSTGLLATEGELRLPVRLDLLPKAGGSSIMIDSPTRPQIELWESMIGDCHVSIRPFTWDYARVSIYGVFDNWTPIKEWFFRWFDPDDQNCLNKEGLYGVVHFLSDPEIEEGVASLTVDFGSAPIEAFFSLLDAFLAMRPNRVEVA